MVTKRWLEEKWLNPWLERRKAENFAKGYAEGYAEGYVEGIAIGQAKERRRWSEWNRRRMEATAKGAPFDEPPPAPLPTPE